MAILSPVNLIQLTELRANISSMKKVCVAYSGGIDSSLVAAIAYEQLGSNALAITGVSDSLAPYLLDEATKQAKWIGIKHHKCLTNELNDKDYELNPRNRCFACKRELHRHLKEISKAAKGSQVIDGVNHDDINDDHRPGIQAAKEAGVRSPLAETKLKKVDIRIISKALGLPWWDKPSQPCLASRFPYGEKLKSEYLIRVGQAEKWLISNGFKEIRVRSNGLYARIEVPKEEIQLLIALKKRKEMVDYFLSIGFESISVDLEGLISGKLNREKELPNELFLYPAE